MFIDYKRKIFDPELYKEKDYQGKVLATKILSHTNRHIMFVRDEI